jgi:pimeloyl-ACP methyl ester carboxylesterase
VNMKNDATIAWRDEYPFESHYLDIDGLRYHYLDEGEGRPIILVHGNPTWSFMFRKLVPALSTTHRVIVPDHIGCGLSDKPHNYPYRLENHIENLQRLINELNLEKIDMVVHDWGGAIGMGYAVDAPENMHRITAMNTAAFLSEDCPWQVRVCRTPFLGALLVRGFNAFVNGALKTTIKHQDRLTPAIREGFRAPYDSWAHRVAVHGFIKDIPMKNSHPTHATLAHIQKRLGRLNAKPMMICWGMKDFCFTKAFLDTWKQYFPNAQVHEFSDAGHYVLEDAHERIIPLLHEFLEETETTTAQPS